MERLRGAVEIQHKKLFSSSACEPFVLMSSDNYQESPPSDGQCFKLRKLKNF